jgi:hypothetical protein
MGLHRDTRPETQKTAALFSLISLLLHSPLWHQCLADNPRFHSDSSDTARQLQQKGRLCTLELFNMGRMYSIVGNPYWPGFDLSVFSTVGASLKNERKGLELPISPYFSILITPAN